MDFSNHRSLHPGNLTRYFFPKVADGGLSRFDLYEKESFLGLARWLSRTNARLLPDHDGDETWFFKLSELWYHIISLNIVTLAFSLAIR